MNIFEPIIFSKHVAVVQDLAYRYHEAKGLYLLKAKMIKV